MRSLLLIVFTLSLLSPSVVRAVTIDDMIAWPWKSRAVVEVRGPVQASPMVALFNDAIPEQGPQLVFKETEVWDCDFGVPEKAAITICWLPDDYFAYGIAAYDITKGHMVGANVGIQRGGVDDPTLYCHELMHALTGLADRSGTQPGKSCLYGHGEAPGVWDREFFAKLYTGDRPRKRHR